MPAMPCQLHQLILLLTAVIHSNNADLHPVNLCSVNQNNQNLKANNSGILQHSLSTESQETFNCSLILYRHEEGTSLAITNIAKTMSCDRNESLIINNEGYCVQEEDKYLIAIVPFDVFGLVTISTHSQLRSFVAHYYIGKWLFQ